MAVARFAGKVRDMRHRGFATLPDPADLLGIDRDATRLALLRDGEISLWDVKDRAHPRRLKAEFPLPRRPCPAGGPHVVVERVSATHPGSCGGPGPGPAADAEWLRGAVSGRVRLR